MRASTIEEIKEGLPFQIEEGWLLRIEQIWLLQAASLRRRNGVVIFQAEAENRLVIRFQPATPSVRNIPCRRGLCPPSGRATIDLSRILRKRLQNY